MSHSLSTLEDRHCEVTKWSSKISNGCHERSFEDHTLLMQSAPSSKEEKKVASFSSPSLEKATDHLGMTECHTLANGSVAESIIPLSLSLKTIGSLTNISLDITKTTSQPSFVEAVHLSTQSTKTSFSSSTLSSSAPEYNLPSSAPEASMQSETVLSSSCSISHLSLITASSSYATALSSVDSTLSSSDGHLNSNDNESTPPGNVEKSKFANVPDIDDIENDCDSKLENLIQKNILCNRSQPQAFTQSKDIENFDTLSKSTQDCLKMSNDVNKKTCQGYNIPVANSDSPPRSSANSVKPSCASSHSDAKRDSLQILSMDSSIRDSFSDVPVSNSFRRGEAIVIPSHSAQSSSAKKASSSIHSSPFGGLLTKLKDVLPSLSTTSDAMRVPQLEKSTTALILQDRQPGLPSKDPSENAKHRMMYENIVEEVKKKEKKEAKRNLEKQKNQLKMEELMSSALKVWKRDLLPYWEDVRSNYNTRQLWWHGIPPSIRGVVWKLVIGNDLNITKELYEICLQRFQELLKTSSSLPSSSSSSTSASPSLSKLAGKTSSSSSLTSSSTTKHVLSASVECPSLLSPVDCRERDNPVSRESSVELIRLDVSRTFPSLCIFQKIGPYHEYLEGLLGAYVCYRPDVGYVQGMSFVAAILLLNMEVHDAFICFANLLNRPIFIAFFRLNADMMKIYFHTYNFFFKNNMPKLYGHFLEQKLSADLYIIDWVFSLYSKCFNLDIVSRIWDVFFRDGEQFLFRTALGILKLFQPVLLNMDFIQMAQFLVRPPESQVDQAELFQSIENIDMECKGLTFRQVLEQFKANQLSGQH